MIKKIAAVSAWGVAAILLFFSARRWLFIFSTLQAGPVQPETEPLILAPFNVLLLVPVRNEIEALPGLMPALDRLAYPAHKLRVVFINDGSTDGSEAILRRWIADRLNWHLLSLAQNVGKAGALNAALQEFAQGDVIAVYDADERPQPAALRYLVQPFIDCRVGGVSGQRAVSNKLSGPAACYSTFEGLVHQFVTMRAKDRLNLVPALLGSNCAYRRPALASVGNFRPGALLEDSDLTVRLARSGWQTCFVPEAVSYYQVPVTIWGYWQQHMRWVRGFNDVAGKQAHRLLFNRRLSVAQKIELLAFSAGYLDRLALPAAGVLAALGNRPAFLAMAISLFTPLAQIVSALYVARQPAALWAQIVWVPLFFGVDVATAMAGYWNTLRNSPQKWEERRSRR